MFDPKRIASNIKNYRVACRFTQSELAEQLSVSVQAVSKWECGIALPDLPKLYALAELFSVSVDEMLGKDEEAKKMMIGIAGGGFATDFLLFDEAGNILGRKTLTAANPNYYGMERCCDILKMGIDTLAGIFTKINGIFVGLAGADSGDNNSRITEFLRRNYPTSKILVDSNIQNVLACFPKQKKAAFVICDTSAVVCAKSGTEVRRFGGWGYRLERSGSLLSIGRDALTAVLMAKQGIGSPTVLTEYVTEYFGKPLEHSLTHVYNSDINALADFAPFVFRAHADGDAVATDILERNMEDIVRMIQKAEEKYDCNHTVVLTAYLKEWEGVMIEMLKRKGLGEYNFLVSQVSQDYGACICCAQMCGLDSERFRDAFAKQYCGVNTDTNQPTNQHR